jgi:hypothetical protein
MRQSRKFSLYIPPGRVFILVNKCFRLVNTVHLKKVSQNFASSGVIDYIWKD